METPKTVAHAEYVADCTCITQKQWDNYMQGTTKASGKRIRNIIKEHLPELYASLCLAFPNPFESRSVKKKGLLVYVHSGIEYFIAYR